MLFYRRASYTKNRKEKAEKFPLGCLGKFYRSLVDNVDSFLRSDFYGRIANDAVCLFLWKTCKSIYWQPAIFSKGMQDDINHYVSRDRINNASLRQKLAP